MVRKKVDERVRTLIENCTKTKHRSLIVLVGDHGKDQVVNLHYIQSKAAVKSRPSVLWCYKKELGFSTHRQKRMRQIKKQIQRGLHDPDKDDPFDLFISSTNIRWCYYKETHKVLGNTFGMCVLQDFEAITPNILARTIETVEGGGIVVLLLRTMSSLKQLYTMTQDVHSRFRTESHQDVVSRFNERFVLSLSSCENCIVLDDELNLLPISKHCRDIKPIVVNPETALLTEDENQLKQLKESLIETQPIGSLIEKAKTLDQAKAILTFVDAISEKTLRSTVALTAARGRGKSAALGTAIAGAVSYGYSNIFVTAPSPENLKTVFDFVLQGFDSLKYKEHIDYEIIQSTISEYNKAIVRINIFREHRQTIQYIQPSDKEALAQAELVVIDEAAAIPLPIVKDLLGPYLVFMSSTINGYEGTGRSLSLKLLQNLREQQGNTHQAAKEAIKNIHGNNNQTKGDRKVHEARWQVAGEAAQQALKGVITTGRILREIELETPIRYAVNDSVEKWLNELLCLDVKNINRLLGGTPHPSECELFYVNRDSLFSYHKLSEKFLQKMMSLYVASHYKNQPNDLQLMSDAPAHQLFVLLGKQAEEQGNAGQLPDILCVIQVALEGEISQENVKAQLSRGQRASGDLIPWTISQQFQDVEFASLSGARVVRIATHPDVTKMGYGSRAIELLTKYYQGEITSGIHLEEQDKEEQEDKDVEKENKDVEKENNKDLLTERIKPRKKLPPLLIPIIERPAERLHWFGTSFGLTSRLNNFWNKLGFHPVYIRQTKNDLTGEHTVIMLKSLECNDLLSSPESGWLNAFFNDARRRFISLLAYEFRNFDVSLALSLVYRKRNQETNEFSCNQLTPLELQLSLTDFDMKRLESYARNMVDYHMIVDLLPKISSIYFLERLPKMTLSYLQSAIIIGIGLQHKTIDDLQKELNLPSNQLLALFNKSIRKFNIQFREIQEQEIQEQELNSSSLKKTIQIEKDMLKMEPTTLSLKEDMELNGKQGKKELEIKQKEMLKSLDLLEYVVKGDEKEWDEALKNGKKRLHSGIQIKSQEKKSNEKQKKKEQKNKNYSNESKKKHKKSKFANL